MTIWKNEGWDRPLKERLGEDVYKFLSKDDRVISYLSDSEYINQHFKPQARNFQLEDNSLFVLHICKVFEGVLYLIAKELSLFILFHNGQEPDSIRGFYKSKRSDIEQYIDQHATNWGLSTSQAQLVKDKLFSTVEDFTERNRAVHFGSMLKVGEIDNFDAIITKIRDLVRVFLDHHLIQI